MSPFERHFQDVLELVYEYRLSFYYQIHMALVLLLSLFLIYLALQEWRSQRRAYSFQQGRGHALKSSSEWVGEVEERTAEEVRKLRESAEYRNYLEAKNRPNSHYNRHIEVEEIVFSDEEDEQGAYEARVYGQPSKPKLR